jgi:hypothetical protein
VPGRPDAEQIHDPLIDVPDAHRRHFDHSFLLAFRAVATKELLVATVEHLAAVGNLMAMRCFSLQVSGSTMPAGYRRRPNRPWMPATRAVEDGSMVNHTMIVSFDEALPSAELDQYLADIERVMLESGFVAAVASRRHIPVPGEGVIPALVATAIVQVSVPDTDALAKAFAAPGLHEVIGRWQSRYPYKVAWANHEPLD